MFFDFCVQTVKSNTVVSYNERKRQIGGLETFIYGRLWTYLIHGYICHI